MLPETFWNDVPPLDIIEYANNVEAESSVADATTARDCEIQALCKLHLIRTGAEPEMMKETVQSRVNTRRLFFGEWTNDGGPFSEEEVLNLRSQVKPWAFPPDFRSLLAEIFV